MQQTWTSYRFGIATQHETCPLIIREPNTEDVGRLALGDSRVGCSKSTNPEGKRPLKPMMKIRSSSNSRRYRHNKRKVVSESDSVGCSHWVVEKTKQGSSIIFNFGSKAKNLKKLALYKKAVRRALGRTTGKRVKGFKIRRKRFQVQEIRGRGHLKPLCLHGRCEGVSSRKRRSRPLCREIGA